MAGKNIKQVYDTNPTSEIPAGALLYLGLDPYGAGDSSAILSEDFFGSPLSIGDTTPNTGKFTVLEALTEFKAGASGQFLIDNTGIITSSLVVSTEGEISLTSVGNFIAQTSGNYNIAANSSDLLTLSNWTATIAGNLNFDVSGTVTIGDAITANAWTGNIIPSSKGGTDFSTYSIGDILYGNVLNGLSKLTGNSTTDKKFLSQTGTGTGSAAPSWNSLSGADITGFADGSIIFSEDNELIEDNTNIFWDNFNKRLGIGTNVPELKVHIVEDLYPVIKTTKTNGTPKSWHFGGQEDNFIITETAVADVLTIVPGGNTSVGNVPAVNKFDIQGNCAIGSNFAGTENAPTDGLIIEGNVSIGSPANTYKFDVYTGDIAVMTAGNTLRVAGGTDAMIGTVSMSGGTASVSNVNITNSHVPLVTRLSAGGTIGNFSVAVTAGVGFIITSTSGTDSSLFAYFIPAIA